MKIKENAPELLVAGAFIFWQLNYLYNLSLSHGFADVTPVINSIILICMCVIVLVAIIFPGKNTFNPDPDDDKYPDDMPVKDYRDLMRADLEDRRVSMELLEKKEYSIKAA